MNEETQKVIEGLFVAAYTESNLIDSVVIFTDLEEAIREMNKKLFDDFDREKDDARIFNGLNEEVYSFPDVYASHCSDHGMTEEQYVEFAVKLWKGEFKEEDDGEEDVVIEYLEALETLNAEAQQEADSEV